LIARPGSQPAQVAGVGRPELEHPPPDRLVRNLEAGLGQELLDVAVAQSEPEIEPDRVPGKLGKRWRE
jgi:hypothetical protein